jgi:glucose-1-phosphate adenylyltransferase
MGNYVFTTEVLLDLVQQDAMRDDSKHDIGGDFIPALVGGGVAHVYDFTKNEISGVTEREHAYWRDVGTLDSYFDAHMDLVSVDPVFNLYNEDWPIFTSDVTAPPAKVVAVAQHGAGRVSDSLMSNGVVISGGYVSGSVLSPYVRVEPGAHVDRCVLLEDVTIGAGAKVKNAIIDKHVVIPEGARVGYDREEDLARGFTVTESGIVAIAKNAPFET